MKYQSKKNVRNYFDKKSFQDTTSMTYKEDRPNSDNSVRVVVSEGNVRQEVILERFSNGEVALLQSSLKKWIENNGQLVAEIIESTQ